MEHTAVILETRIREHCYRKQDLSHLLADFYNGHFGYRKLIHIKANLAVMQNQFCEKKSFQPVAVCIYASSCPTLFPE